MMSATPIPRTLALTIYGDQELSIIDEMPPGRKEIITKVVHPEARKQANLFIDDHFFKTSAGISRFISIRFDNRGFTAAITFIGTN